MFGLSFFEIVVICIVALLFVRPKDLPDLLRKIGRFYRHVTDQLDNARRAFKDASRTESGGWTESGGKDESRASTIDNTEEN